MKNDKTFEELINFGNDFIEFHFPEIARKYFQQALKIKPKNPVALDGLAWTYHMEGKNSKAKNFLERAIQLDKNFAEAYTDLGCVLQELGDADKAEKMHKKCLEIDPAREDAKFNLVHLYFSAKRFDELELFFEDNADVLSKKIELLQLLGEVKIIKKDFREAVNIFNKCLSIDEHNVEAGILLSFVEFELEQQSHSPIKQ